ncbi:MAG: TetR/AcrR family transcriptional regulator [Eubacteriales bacterium]|nr:TetR/AcrR family transcriptional regulator [Eubacteriales bacterium]
MRPINEKLAGELLEAGKREFLERGFQGASMRSIAAAAGVTTGALYRYYTDKAAIFDALVSEPALELLERYRKIQMEFSTLTVEQKLADLPEISDDGQEWMMWYIYDHFDAFKLVVCCSAGTQYEHYLETLTEIEVNASHILIEGMKAAGMEVQPIDDELIHIVSSMLFNGMFETIRHDMSREKAMQHMCGLKEFYSAGWFKILGIPYT